MRLPLVIDRYKYACLLFILIVFHAANNYIWLKQDNESLSVDTAAHINLIVSLQQALRDIYFSTDSPPEKLRSFFVISGAWPLVWPYFFHLAAALTTAFLGDILFGIRFFNIFYFGLLIVSIYLLGKKLFSRQAGMIAAYFVSFYPGIFGLSRKCGLDFPLIGAVCLTVYFLVMCDGFKRRIYSVLSGISFGLAMLIKGQAIVFIIGPFIYAALRGIRGNLSKKYFLNISISLMLALTVSLAWWHKIFFIQGKESRYCQAIISSLGKGDVLQNMPYYFNTIYSNLSPLFFILFFLGLLFCFRKSSREGLFFLVWWLLPPYFLFSAFSFLLYWRYIFPIFGAVSLISAIGLLGITSKKLKRILIPAAIALGIWQFFMVSYRGPWMPFVGTSEIAHPPVKNNYRLVVNEFMRILESYSGFRDKNIAIIEEEYLKGDFCIRLGYLLKSLNNKNYIYNDTLFLSANGIAAPRYRISKDFLINIDNYEYLIAFSHDPENPDFSALLEFSRPEERETVIEAIKHFSAFKIIGRNVLLPEGVHIFLLKKQ